MFAVGFYVSGDLAGHGPAPCDLKTEVFELTYGDFRAVYKEWRHMNARFADGYIPLLHKHHVVPAKKCGEIPLQGRFRGIHGGDVSCLRFFFGFLQKRRCSLPVFPLCPGRFTQPGSFFFCRAYHGG